MVQLVKDLALSLLWHGFDPWPGKFYMLRGTAKKKKEREREKRIQLINVEEMV